jgi:hypothetical protein
MKSLCETCKYSMLIKIGFSSGDDTIKHVCLINPEILNNLRVGHFRGKGETRGKRDYPNVIECTQNVRREEDVSS